MEADTEEADTETGAEMDAGTDNKKLVVTADEAIGYGKLVSLVTGAGYTEAHCKLAGNTTLMAHGVCVEANGICFWGERAHCSFLWIDNWISRTYPRNYILAWIVRSICCCQSWWNVPTESWDCFNCIDFDA